MYFKFIELLLWSILITLCIRPTVQAQSSDPIVQQRLAFIEATPEYDWEEHHGFMPIIKNNKYGLMNQEGELVVAPKYDKIEAFSGGLAKVSFDSRIGFIDTTGKEVIHTVYDTNSFGFTKDGVTIMRQGSRYGLVHKNGTRILPIEYNDIGWFNAAGLAVIKRHKKYGYVNTKGEIVLPFQYDYARNFSYGLAQVEKDGKKYLIDIKGNKRFQIDYDYISGFSDGLAKVRRNGQHAFVNKEGKIVIPFESYERIDDFKNGVAIAKKISESTGSSSQQEQSSMVPQLKSEPKSYFGLIDRQGRIIADFEYDEISVYRDCFYALQRGTESRQLMIRDGKVISLDADDTYDFSEGFATVKRGGKWGLINKNGELLIPFQYDYMLPFSKGLSAVRRAGKWGFIDAAGAERIAIQYDKVSKFSNGISVVVKSGQYGLIDTLGRVILPFEHDFISDFKEDVAFVTKDNKKGCINQKGELIVPIELDYKMIEQFSEGLARVVQYRDDKKQVGFINKQGALAIPFIDCDFMSNFSNGFAKVQKDGKVGIINTKGKMIVPIAYDKIRRHPYSLEVYKAKKLGILNSKGEEIVPIQYEHVHFITDKLMTLSLGNDYEHYQVINLDGKEVFKDYEFKIYRNLVRAKKDGNLYIYNQKGMKLE